jgi:hypothetical protein
MYMADRKRKLEEKTNPSRATDRGLIDDAAGRVEPNDGTGTQLHVLRRRYHRLGAVYRRRLIVACAEREQPLPPGPPAFACALNSEPLD